MIDLATKTMYLMEKAELIRSFEVWFRTPFGLHSTLEKAKQTCEEQQWDVNTVIVPVAVAVGSTLYEEIGRA